MNKLVTLTVAAILGAALVSGTAGASYDDDHGNDVSSLTTHRINNNKEIDSSTDIKSSSTNNQTAESGKLEVIGNTTVGKVTSANASNENKTDTCAVINAECPEPSEVDCTTCPGEGPGNGNPIVPNENGGNGNGSPVNSGGNGGGMGAGFASLPATSGSSPAAFAGIVAAVLGGLAAASRFGVAAYGRLS